MNPPRFLLAATAFMLALPAYSQSPEISVSGNGQNISNMAGPPSLGDYRDFGSTDMNGGTVTRTFTIHNSGTDLLFGDIMILNYTHTRDTSYFINGPTGFTIDPGGMVNFTVTFDPSEPYLNNAEILIINNDDDEANFFFFISGYGEPPDIVVNGNGMEIADGDTTPSMTDHTDFGNVAVDDGTVTRVFAVNNFDLGTLHLTGSPRVALSGSSAFRVTSQPVLATLGSFGSTEFEITFDPSEPGLATATVSIANDDYYKNPYTFVISGVGDGPKIAVSGKGVNISNNDVIPSESDGTDFGNVAVTNGMEETDGTLTNIFTISNSGMVELKLTGNPLVSVSGDTAFSVSGQPLSSTVAAEGGTVSFAITFDPEIDDTVSALVSIASDDQDKNPFVFAVSGTGTVPEINLIGNGADIANGDVTPSNLDDTDFGKVDVDDDTTIRTFTIQNSGLATLELTGTPPVALSGSSAFTVTTQPASSSVEAEGGMVSFAVTYDPGSEDTDEAVVSIASNDDDETPFTFSIKGEGVKPRISLSGNGVNIVNGDVIPGLLDNTDFGGTPAVGGILSRTFTIHNPGEGTLKLTGNPRVAISGSNAFVVFGQPTATVEPDNGSTFFSITFNPALEGIANAMVSIASNAENSPLFSFAIQGTGTGLPDTKKPTLKLVTPAGKMVSAALPLTVAGVAGDNVAVDRVEVVLNGGAPLLADLGASSKPTAVPFTAQILPVVGDNTLVVTVYDPSGNSTSVTRVFTFERRYLLTLVRAVPAALEAAPDKAGTLSPKAAVAKNATALTKGNPQASQVLPGTLMTLTAAAKTGHIFSHWTGLPEGTQVHGNVVVFAMPEADTNVRAVFVANPFIQGAFAALGPKPLFQGLLRPDEETPSGNDTVGFLSAALVPAKGSLSGKLWMDGLVVAFTGALHGDGSVWLKSGALLASKLPFAGRELALTWDESGLAMSVTRSVNAVNHLSAGKARPPLYSKTRPVRGALLDAKGSQGYYTLALPAVEQSPARPAAEFPQGAGHAGLTLLGAGTLKLAGMLAEGTKVTAAAYLVAGDAAEVFVVLPTPGGKTKAGSLLGTLIFDETPADSDVSSADMTWFRPAAQTKPETAQAYRSGWPGGLALGVEGALYDGALPVQTALGLSATTPDGNAALFFRDGKLVDEVSAAFNIEGSKVVKLNAQDKSWSLVLAPKTGMLSGAFTPDWAAPAKKLPAFSGVLLQKGAGARGRGFFLGNAAGDTEPESEIGRAHV